MSAVVADAVWSVAQRFPTGVSVVTSGAGALARGATVSTFCFLSHEPALISICLRRGSGVLGLIRDHGAFTVNVLASDQESVARRFASRSRGADQFDGVGWERGDAGVPRLRDTVCWLDCRPREVIAAGDHELVVASVTGLGGGSGRTPLLYFAGALHRGAIESEDS